MRIPSSIHIYILCILYMYYIYYIYYIYVYYIYIFVWMDMEQTWKS